MEPLARLQLVTVTFAGFPYREQVEAFADALVKSRWLTEVAPRPIAASHFGHAVLPASSAAPLGAFLQAANSGALPRPDDASGLVYVAYAPLPCEDPRAAGFHSRLAQEITSTPYAWVAGCERSLAAFTTVAAHEIAEIITDQAAELSEGGLYFDEAQAPWTGEVADICNFSRQWVECGFTFATAWSNAAAGTDLPPCVPWPQGTRYANVSPDPAAPETVPAGSSATIRLTGWATAPGPPWRLRALPDFTARQDFDPAPSFSGPTIDNGTTVLLTVTVPAGTSPGAQATIRVGSVTEAGNLADARSNDWPVRIVAR